MALESGNKALVDTKSYRPTLIPRFQTTMKTSTLLVLPLQNESKENQKSPPLSGRRRLRQWCWIPVLHLQLTQTITSPSGKGEHDGKMGTELGI